MPSPKGSQSGNQPCVASEMKRGLVSTSPLSLYGVVSLSLPPKPALSPLNSGHTTERDFLPGVECAHRQGSSYRQTVRRLGRNTFPSDSTLQPSLVRGWHCTRAVRRCVAVSYTHLRAHETGRNLVCRLLL